MTGKESYVPTHAFSVWADLYAGKRFQPGLFLGYAKNLGAGESVSKVYVRNADIDRAYRIAPRMAWQAGFTRLCIEIEYTAAAYGTTNERAKVVDTTTLGNLRVLSAGFRGCTLESHVAVPGDGGSGRIPAGLSVAAGQFTRRVPRVETSLVKEHLGFDPH